MAHNEDHRTTEDPGPVAPTPNVETAPDRIEIGPYRLLQRIGEGGMGEVWLADQQRPVRRRVAVKVIKAGMDTDRVVARFEAERQALAMMDHPAIARIYDAGSTPRGRPFFAMEYVKGVPVTEHCDRHRLTVRERLELFLRICDGVQHAHQKAVIHRDLKPTNVLVSLSGDVAAPKIIDFGVAKATAQSLTERTMHTQIGTMVGTPAYMSPEQAQLTGQDIDTRTDVYSLGVMLYELLVDSLPFEASSESTNRDELLRRICEEDPQRPSVRLSTSAEDSATVAGQRQTQVQHLRSELRGDLDWIVMRALEKDRTRRYGSPNELAEDIRRYLVDQPVSACPPSTGYRLRKFVRRHRTTTALSALGLAVLLAFAATMTVMAGRIARERDRANREAAASERVAEFLGDMLGTVDQGRMGASLEGTLRDRVALAANPKDPGSAESLARIRTLDAALEGVNLTDASLHLLDEQVLARASDTIESQLGDDPAIAGRLHATLAGSYINLGLFDRAITESERAIRILEPEVGQHDPSVYAAKSVLGYAFNRTGQLDRAIAHYRETLAGLDRREPPDAATTHAFQNDLGDVLRYAGRYDEAEQVLTEALALAETLYAIDAEESLINRNNLALVHDAQGRYAKAAEILSEAHEASLNRYGAEDPYTLSLGSNLGTQLVSSHQFEAGLTLLESNLEVESRLYGDDHFDTMISEREFARGLRLAGDPARAVAILEPLLARMERVVGLGHQSTLATGLNLADALHDMGRSDEAATLLEDMVDAARSNHVEGMILPGLLLNHARVLTSIQRFGDAEASARAALDLYSQRFPVGFWRVASARTALGEALLGQGRTEDAAPLLEAGFQALLAAPGEASADEARAAATRIAAAYQRLGLDQEAAAWRTALTAD
jgi:serine/threonine protein kinase/tetratricopeptide (TPR) repeat protein